MITTKKNDVLWIVEIVLGFQTNGDFFCSVFVVRGKRFFFDSIKITTKSIMSNVKKINIPLEDSICGDVDEESGEDDETFSSSKK